MRYTYRNTVTGAEFQSDCNVVGSNLVRLESTAITEEVKPKEEAETKTPKKTVKRGAKK